VTEVVPPIDIRILAVLPAMAAATAWWLAAGTRYAVRGYVRAAAALYMAVALAVVFAFVPATVAPLVASLGPVLLAFAVYASFRHPTGAGFAATAIAAAGFAGIAAAVSGVAAFALVPQFVGIAVMLAISRRGLVRLNATGIQLAAGSAALFAAACSLILPGMEGRVAFLLFSAAGLLGVSLAVAGISDTFVKRRRRVSAGAAVSRER
jgi:hypothetical protein